MRNFPVIPVVLVLLLVSFVSFFGFDAGLGKSDGARAAVIAKEHTAAWVQFIWHTNSDGTGWMQQIHHPATWVLVFDNNMTIDVSRGLYHNANQGQRFVITFRVGKWSGIRYGAQVHNDSNVEQ